MWHSDLRFILVGRAQMAAGEQLCKPAWLLSHRAILRVVGLQSSYQLPLWELALPCPTECSRISSSRCSS